MGQFNTHRAYAVPAVALILCCTALVGLGFAYNGTFVDQVGEAEATTHVITVDSSTDLEYSGSAVYFDMHRDRASDGTVTYTFASVQNNTNVTYVGPGSVSVLLKLGTVKITSGTDASKAVAVTADNSVDLSGYPYLAVNGILICEADASSSAAVATYNAEATQSGIYADIYVSMNYVASEINDANAGALKLPALTVTVTAEAAATA